MKSARAAAFALAVVALLPALAGAAAAAAGQAASPAPAQPVWTAVVVPTGICSTFCRNGQSFEQVTTQTNASTCCSDSYNPCPAGWTKATASFTPNGGRAMLCPIN